MTIKADKEKITKIMNIDSLSIQSASNTLTFSQFSNLKLLKTRQDILRERYTKISSKLDSKLNKLNIRLLKTKLSQHKNLKVSEMIGKYLKSLIN